MHQITCSIVLYKNDAEFLIKTISSVINNNLKLKLYLIDNSPTPELKITLFEFIKDDRIIYIFNNKNLGYGKAHNIALKNSVHESSYHLILNPDVEFDKGVLEKIYSFMQLHKTVGQLLPNVLYNNGKLQKLCNLLPQPLNLISRRFFKNTSWARKLNDEYELKGFNYDQCLNIPNLSGCFMFLRTNILKQTGFFDERYFMYMEDVDLCRRIHAISKTIFFPDASIIHGFEKESYSNKIVLRYHIHSAIKYFNKWGWAFDKERKKINRRILDEINKDNDVEKSAFKKDIILKDNC